MPASNPKMASAKVLGLDGIASIRSVIIERRAEVKRSCDLAASERLDISSV